MICEECNSQGLKSKVYPGAVMCTAMGYQTYYDEQGKLHTHDPNITTESFHCSNNHSWSRKQSGSCWCGWNT